MVFLLAEVFNQQRRKPWKVERRFGRIIPIPSTVAIKHQLRRMVAEGLQIAQQSKEPAERAIEFGDQKIFVREP